MLIIARYFQCIILSCRIVHSTDCPQLAMPWFFNIQCHTKLCMSLLTLVASYFCSLKNQCIILGIFWHIGSIVSDKVPWCPPVSVNLALRSGYVAS